MVDHSYFNFALGWNCNLLLFWLEFFWALNLNFVFSFTSHRIFNLDYFCDSIADRSLKSDWSDIRIMIEHVDVWDDKKSHLFSSKDL